jgi:hypothetical protein
MIYTSGEKKVNFYEDVVKGQSLREFKSNWKHLGWSDEELKQVHSLMNKKKVVEDEPPSFNEPSSVSRTNSPMPDEEN